MNDGSWALLVAVGVKKSEYKKKNVGKHRVLNTHWRKNIHVLAKHQ